MEFQEYPKRIYKGNESIVVNTKAEENNFLGIITDDKENERRIQSNITQGKESQQIKSIKETSAEEIGGNRDVQIHGEKESFIGILKRKPGRPKKF